MGLGERGIFSQRKEHEDKLLMAPLHMAAFPSPGLNTN